MIAKVFLYGTLLIASMLMVLLSYVFSQILTGFHKAIQILYFEPCYFSFSEKGLRRILPYFREMFLSVSDTQLTIRDPM